MWLRSAFVGRLAGRTFAISNYVEFVHDNRAATRDVMHLKHPICLGVADVAKAGAILQARKLPQGSKPPDVLETGVNGKRQIKYFEPDGTRLEQGAGHVFREVGFIPEGTATGPFAAL